MIQASTDALTPGQHPGDTFARRHIPALDRTVNRLGIACDKGISADEMRQALDLGAEYVFWTPRMTKMVEPLKEALRRDRERYVVTTGPTFGFLPGSLRKAVDKSRKMLDVDYLDVLQLFWLGKTSALTQTMLDELVRLRQSGAVRRIGVSIHDRARAGQLAADSPLDLFMIRYNAAHPGAEQDIFPHLAKRRPAVVAYTATAWGKLLQAPSGWNGAVPDPGDCYRFALSDPNVDVVLTGPENLAQFKQNLKAMEKGPMQGEELAQMRRFGKLARESKAALRFGFGA